MYVQQCTTYSTRYPTIFKNIILNIKLSKINFFSSTINLIEILVVVKVLLLYEKIKIMTIKIHLTTSDIK